MLTSIFYISVHSFSIQMGECDESQTSSPSMTHPPVSQPDIQSNPHQSTGSTSIGERCIERVELLPYMLVVKHCSLLSA